MPASSGDVAYKASLMGVHVSQEWVDHAAQHGAMISFYAGRVGFYWYAPYDPVSVAEYMSEWSHREPGQGGRLPHGPRKVKPAPTASSTPRTARKPVSGAPSECEPTTDEKTP